MQPAGRDWAYDTPSDEEVSFSHWHTVIGFEADANDLQETQVPSFWLKWNWNQQGKSSHSMLRE